MLTKKSGIYRIYSLLDEKEYIGSAVSQYQRMHHHLHHLKNNKHSNAKLQNYINKYGIDNISFETILECEKHVLIQEEQRFIDKRNPYFNICRVAGNSLGRTHTDKTKKHLSNIRKGIYPKHLKGANTTPEARSKISEKAKKRGVSRELVEAAIRANTGSKHSNKHRRQIALSQSKIPVDELWRVQKMLDCGIRQVDIAREYNVSQRVISRVKNRIGIYGELDKDYYEAALNRFDIETRQTTLALG